MTSTIPSGKANGANGAKLLRSPPMIVFVLGLLTSVLAWALRQETINNNQQNEIKTLQRQMSERFAPDLLARRLGAIEGRLDALEKR